ncbi:MAG TPA: SRPBCC family protein [Baekduia sp.]|uniref:SRPBCC family protein n=1 Tax=Baekduia sp. TaxID=2600305 RepID=UPI002D79DA95|nr:SRPBCC family protein [Baekduia sp.]HET6506444.1 SRPBCC family protein [Baekduia sp.]
MTEVRDRRWIAAAPRDVWRLLSAIERYPDWCPWARTVRHAGGPAGLGVGYQTGAGEWRIVEFDPPRRQVHRAEHPRLARTFDRVFELRSDGADGTWVELIVRSRPALGWAGRAFDRAILRPQEARRLPRALDGIERLLAAPGLRALG